LFKSLEETGLLAAAAKMDLEWSCTPAKRLLANLHDHFHGLFCLGFGVWEGFCVGFDSDVAGGFVATGWFVGATVGGGRGVGCTVAGG
jgi:hypothetical protein